MWWELRLDMLVDGGCVFGCDARGEAGNELMSGTIVDVCHSRW
jgi:hypothetical protein